MAHREREINVSRSNYSVIDNEFDSMRERFDNEMRRVEDEMGRLRREFEGYTPKMTNGAQQPPIQQRNYHTTTTTNRYTEPAIQNGTARYNGNGTTAMNGQPAGNVAQIPRPKYDPYLENLKSPLIKDDSDGKLLRLRFNVSQYRPEEVTVKTVDNRLLVHAKHEEKSPQRTVYREYNQEFMLPRGTNPESITSTLSTDGILTVEAPLPAMDQHQLQQQPPQHQIQMR